MEQEEYTLDFQKWKILKGDKELIDLDDLLFLLESGVRYNEMIPIPESQKFVEELRERVGLGFTKEQFEEIKKEMQRFNEE